MAGLKDILAKRNSGCIAKRRLGLILITDRAGCTPEILEMIKAVSKYMGIDAKGLEMKVFRADETGTEVRFPVLCASVPIRALLSKGTY